MSGVQHYVTSKHADEDFVPAVPQTSIQATGTL